jgi:CLN3 protein
MRSGPNSFVYFPFAARLPGLRIYIPVLDLRRFTGTTQEAPTSPSCSTVVHPSDFDLGIRYRFLRIHRFCSSHCLCSNQYGRVMWWFSIVSSVWEFHVLAPLIPTLSVNAFYRVGQESVDENGIETQDPDRRKQEREFRIGSMGFADSLGILLASLIAMPAEIGLCKIQAHRGKDLCVSL